MSSKQLSRNATTRNAQRIARVQELRKSKNEARRVAATQSAYMLAVQQLAAQYGLPVPNTMSVRPFNKPQQHAPSAVQGACGRVHALAEQNNGVRSATLAACKAEGINPATAATQFAKWQKAQRLAAAHAECGQDAE